MQSSSKYTEIDHKSRMLSMFVFVTGLNAVSIKQKAIFHSGANMSSRSNGLVTGHQPGAADNPIKWKQLLQQLQFQLLMG